MVYQGACRAASHNYVHLHCLTTELTKLFSELSTILVYADLPGMRASDSPQTTIPPLLILFFMIKKQRSDMFLIDASLTGFKRRKYQEIQLEFDCLGAACFYDTLNQPADGFLTWLQVFQFLLQREFSWQEITQNGQGNLEH